MEKVSGWELFTSVLAILKDFLFFPLLPYINSCTKVLWKVCRDCFALYPLFIKTVLKDFSLVERQTRLILDLIRTEDDPSGLDHCHQAKLPAFGGQPLL